MGRLHPRVLNPSLSIALAGLIPAATVIDEDPDSRDAEARRNAVRGLTSLALAVGVSSEVSGRLGKEEKAQSVRPLTLSLSISLSLSQHSAHS